MSTSFPPLFSLPSYPKYFSCSFLPFLHFFFLSQHTKTRHTIPTCKTRNIHAHAHAQQIPHTHTYTQHIYAQHSHILTHTTQPTQLHNMHNTTHPSYFILQMEPRTKKIKMEIDDPLSCGSLVEDIVHQIDLLHTKLPYLLVCPIFFKNAFISKMIFIPTQCCTQNNIWGVLFCFY